MYRTKVVLKAVSKKTGRGRLNIEVTFQGAGNRERVYLATEESIESKYWVNGKISRSSSSYKELWRRVELRQNQVKDILFELQQEHGFVNATLLKNSLESEKEEERDIISLFEEYIEVNRITAKYKTAKKLVTIKNQMLRFMGKKKYYLLDFNQKFVNQLTHFWQNNINLQPNTIHKNFRFVMMFLNYLEREGIVEAVKFKKLNYPKPVETNTILLEKSEVKALIDYTPSNARMGRIRDLFLVLIFTGLRFSDGIRISESWVNNGFLYIHTQKTDEKVSIPIHPALKVLLEKYEYNLSRLKISNQKFNKAVKDLCQEVGITKEVEIIRYEKGERKYLQIPKYQLIASHTGRRTFITNSILAGIPLSVIQKITGHKKLSTLQKYVDIAEGVKTQEMDKLSKYYSDL